MNIKCLPVAVLAAVAAGCTSTGNPQAGERAAQVVCEVGERRVCTGITGSRIRKESGMCSCFSIDHVQQF